MTARAAFAWGLCGLLSLGLSSRAQAFRLPVNFKQDAAIGGAGGRYFTGSPTDRYTCKVCHTGAPTPDVRVGGLPFAGYVPGTTYTFVIDWDDTFPSVAFNLEMSDASGRELGTFTTPAVEEASPADLCKGVPAVAIVQGAERTLALLTECGSHQATIRWTAPTAAVDLNGQPIAPQAWFSGSVLVSNKDGSVEGDGVMDLSHVFGLAGQTAPVATTITGGCHVAQPNASSRPGLWAAVWLLIAGCWLRRRRKAVS